MRHMHIYSAFALVLVEGFMKKKPPFVPRLSYNAAKNAEVDLKEQQEWSEKAKERYDLCRVQRIESLVFQFDDPERKTLLAVAPRTAKITRITLAATTEQLQLNKQTVRYTIGLRWLERLNELVADPETLAEYGELSGECISFRGVEAKRLIRQVRFETMATRKTGFDEINKALYLANDTYDRKSVLSGREDDTDNILDAFRDLSTEHTDPVLADLDLTIQLFRRAGLCPLVAIKKD